MSKSTRLLLLGLALLSVSAVADTITLKTGDRLDAKIVRETATEVTIAVQVSAGITDERVIPKTDIAKIDRVPADETAYRAIMNLQPGKNSLLPAQYDGIMMALQGFVSAYPESSHVAEVKQALAAFQAEKKLADTGEVKVDGTWLSMAEALRQRVQIGGRQAFNAMKNANAAGDAIGMLNAFAVLEKNYGGARVLPEAVELARQILPALTPVVERAIDNQKVREAERQLGVKNAAPLDRPDLIAAYQREQAQAVAALAAATAAGLWPPFVTNSERCLKAIAARIPTEMARLEKIPVTAMRDSLRLADQAQAEFARKDFSRATDTLREAGVLWPENELIKRLTAQLAAAKIPPRPDPAATPAATPPAAETTTVKATPAAKPPVATPAVRPATPAAVATPADVREKIPAVEPEPAKPFFQTVGGAVTIVFALALLLAGVTVFNKLRQRTDDAAQE